MSPVAHSHRAAPDADVAIGGRVRLALLALLALAGVATVVGLVALWPDRAAVDDIRAQAPYAAKGVTTPKAEVLSVARPCPTGSGAASQQPGTCGTVHVKVLEGESAGARTTIRVPPEVSTSGLAPGDRLELFRTPAGHGQPVSYSFSSVKRTTPLLWLALLFAVVVVLVAGRRGVMALVGLAVSGLTLY
jgi:uncharacterized membrane protein